MDQAEVPASEKALESHRPPPPKFPARRGCTPIMGA